MPKYQYTIKGKPYHDIDLKSIITTLVSEFELSFTLKETNTRLILQIVGKDSQLQKFEPQLLTTLIKHMNIQSYVKKTSSKRASKDESKHFDLKKAIQLLVRGKLIAIKDHNSFHIVCNASKTKAVEYLREVIGQPTKPLPLMFRNILNLEKLVLLSKKEKSLLNEPNHPFVIAKIKNLHRLERDRYKYLLSPKLNPLNRRISVSLAFSELYQQIFEEIAFPLVSLDAKTKEGVLIIDRETLVKTYGDHFSYIIDTDQTIHAPYGREVYQILYGKTHKISPHENIPPREGTLAVLCDSKVANIGKIHFAPVKILLDEHQIQQPKYSALSILFAYLPIEDILTYNLPFTSHEITNLHHQWKTSTNTQISHSLVTLFDAIASLAGKLYEKSFETESLFLAEDAFEVCEEDLFDYQINNGEIQIDIVSGYQHNKTLKYLASTLTNTISTIIAEIAKESGQDVSLTGMLFNYRDLTELTIEKLEEEGIEYFIT